MADSNLKAHLVKIVLGSLFLSFLALFACFVVGVTLFIQEHRKASSYSKDSCRVTSSSYESIRTCDTGSYRRTIVKCYVPVWQVELGPNGTRSGTIRSNGERSVDSVLIVSDKYRVGTSYPCWYNTKKPSEITWYQPSTFYSIILIVIGLLAVPLGIISFIAFRRLRQHVDL